MVTSNNDRFKIDTNMTDIQIMKKMIDFAFSTQLRNPRALLVTLIGGAKRRKSKRKNKSKKRNKSKKHRKNKR